MKMNSIPLCAMNLMYFWFFIMILPESHSVSENVSFFNNPQSCKFEPTSYFWNENAINKISYRNSAFAFQDQEFVCIADELNVDHYSCVFKNSCAIIHEVFFCTTSKHLSRFGITALQVYKSQDIQSSNIILETMNVTKVPDLSMESAWTILNNYGGKTALGLLILNLFFVTGQNGCKFFADIGSFCSSKSKLLVKFKVILKHSEWTDDKEYKLLRKLDERSLIRDVIYQTRKQLSIPPDMTYVAVWIGTYSLYENDDVTVITKIESNNKKLRIIFSNEPLF